PHLLEVSGQSALVAIVAELSEQRSQSHGRRSFGVVDAGRRPGRSGRNVLTTLKTWIVRVQNPSHSRVMFRVRLLYPRLRFSSALNRIHSWTKHLTNTSITSKRNGQGRSTRRSRLLWMEWLT